MRTRRTNSPLTDDGAKSCATASGSDRTLYSLVRAFTGVTKSSSTILAESGVQASRRRTSIAPLAVRVAPSRDSLSRSMLSYFQEPLGLLRFDVGNKL